MKFRKINLKLLFLEGILYRLIVLTVHFILAYIILGKVASASFTAVAINLLNMIIYYLYHYVFLSMFKVGKDD